MPDDRSSATPMTLGTALATLGVWDSARIALGSSVAL
jgi:hypothetical protein